jgi:hypothetical protein
LKVFLAGNHRHVLLHAQPIQPTNRARRPRRAVSLGALMLANHQTCTVLRNWRFFAVKAGRKLKSSGTLSQPIFSAHLLLRYGVSQLYRPGASNGRIGRTEPRGRPREPPSWAPSHTTFPPSAFCYIKTGAKATTMRAHAAFPRPPKVFAIGKLEVNERGHVWLESALRPLGPKTAVLGVQNGNVSPGIRAPGKAPSFSRTLGVAPGSGAALGCPLPEPPLAC